jgi:1,4-dihydroxy-2-naphthoate octaprenyltransferase
MTTTFWRGFWRLADPKISLASFAGIFLGACMAAADQPLAWGWLAMTVLGVFCVEVAKNASGEIVDFDSGTDLAIADGERSPFSGGKRVLVDRLLTRRQTGAIAAVFFLAAIMIGLVIVMFRDSRVLPLGAMGVGLAWYYHGGTIRLSYRGLGELAVALAVALAYGPLVVCGTYLVQTGDVSAPVLHTSMALGILVAAFLWINEFPDYRADKQAGKNNLVVRLGPRKAALSYVTIVATGYTWLVLTAINLPGAAGLLGGLAGALPAAFSAWRLLSNTGATAALIPAQAASLASFVLMACGAGLSYLLI